MRRLLDWGFVLGVLFVLSLPGEAEERSGFGWPVTGTPLVDRGFEPPVSDYGPGHRGVDLRAPLGAPVLAAGAGWVSYAGLLAGRGVLTVTHPGGLRTTYEPVRAAVAVGDRVVRGEVLGTLTTGHGSCRARLTCLHWGLRRGQDYLNPLSLVNPGPTRLLPVGSATVRWSLLETGAPPGSLRGGAPQGSGSLRAGAPQGSGPRDRPGAAAARGTGGAVAAGSVLLGTVLPATVLLGTVLLGKVRLAQRRRRLATTARGRSVRAEPG